MIGSEVSLPFAVKVAEKRSKKVIRHLGKVGRILLLPFSLKHSSEKWRPSSKYRLMGRNDFPLDVKRKVAELLRMVEYMLQKGS